ncbi:MAG: hypothetical protein M3R55_14835 [Acidobacteriota bacterium]|nr:hypothetical protein [Acidobacteriota bacterium]
MPLLHSVPRSGHASILADFYRQELLKHKDCLELQREYFSDRAIDEAEQGLMRLMAQLEQLCAKEGADDVFATLLRRVDSVSGLSAFAAMSGPARLH